VRRCGVDLRGLEGDDSHLANWTQDGGTVVAGTPFWVNKPTQAYLTLPGMSEDRFSSHAGNVATGEAVGLRCCVGEAKIVNPARPIDASDFVSFAADGQWPFARRSFLVLLLGL
jgi:hypothetical protein